MLAFLLLQHSPREMRRGLIRLASSAVGGWRVSGEAVAARVSTAVLGAGAAPRATQMEASGASFSRGFAASAGDGLQYGADGKILPHGGKLVNRLVTDPAEKKALIAAYGGTR